MAVMKMVTAMIFLGINTVMNALTMVHRRGGCQNLCIMHIGFACLFHLMLGSTK